LKKPKYTNPKKVDAVILAMREAHGAEEMISAKWLETTQHHPALRAAFQSSVGRRFNASMLGNWFTLHIGSQCNGYLLQGRRAMHDEIWHWRIWHSDDEAAAQRAAKAAAEEKAARHVLAVRLKEKRAKEQEERRVHRAANPRISPYEMGPGITIAAQAPSYQQPIAPSVEPSKPAPQLERGNFSDVSRYNPAHGNGVQANIVIGANGTRAHKEGSQDWFQKFLEGR
jgi:hypothetical protein